MNTGKMILIHLFPLFSFLLCIQSALGKRDFPRSYECVPAFNTTEHKRSFDVCLENECFVFRTEVPFVYIDPSMKTIRDQRPFPCSDFRNRFSGQLKGAFFDIVQEMSPLKRTAHCVWGGPKCTFDGILKFINATATAGNKHRWMSGGILMAIPDRIGANTLPSVSLFEDEFRIIGPPISDYTTVGDAWAAIWKPFTRKAWIFMFSIGVFHFLIRVWFSYVFTVPKHQPDGRFDWKQFRNRITFRTKEKQEGDREVEESWERISYFWTFIATIFVAISVLFWEVAIAVQVYETRLKAPVEDLKPERFSLVANSSWVSIFRTVAGPRANWHTSQTMDQLYDVLFNKTNQIDYTVNYGIFNRYQVNERPELCERLRVYDDVPSKLSESRQPLSLSAVWFYSSTVPVPRRVAIDKAIAKQKQSGRILKINNNYAGEAIPSDCKMRSERIDWVLLGLLYSVVTGSLILWLIFSVLLFSMNRRTKRPIEDFHNFECSFSKT